MFSDALFTAIEMNVMHHMNRIRENRCAVRLIILLSTLSMFPGCEILDIKKEVLIGTGEVLVSAQNKAIVSGTVFDVGDSDLVQYGHCWSESNNPTIENDSRTSLGSKSSGGIYNSLLTGLSPGTNYYVRAYVSNISDTLYGEEISLLTDSQNPEIHMPTTSEAIAYYSDNNIVVDGNDNELEWALPTLYPCRGISLHLPGSIFTDSDLACSFKVLFNEEGLMVWIQVTDESIINYEVVSSDDIESWMVDNVELFLHNGEYPTSDGVYTVDNTVQIRFNPFYSSASLPDLTEIQSGRYGRDWKPLEEMYSFVDFIVVPSGEGYNVEAFIRWDLFADKPENLLYIDVQAGDADDPGVLRETLISWNNTDNATRADIFSWYNINYMGRLLLYHQNP